MDGDQPGLRDMLIRAGYQALAQDLCEHVHRPWPVYIASTVTVVGLLEGRFDEQYDDHYAPRDYPPPQAWIFNIVVDEAFRRSGIGTELLEQFVAEAAGAGCTYVALEVNLQHRAGLDARLAFFQRKGFEILETIGEFPSIMGKPIEAVRRSPAPPAV